MGFCTFSQLAKHGRLGNQLFQVAATVGIAEKNGFEYFIPPWEPASFFKGTILQVDRAGDYFPKYEEGPLYYQPIELEHSTDLVGNFQSEKYFEHCADKIREMFTLLPRYAKEVAKYDWLTGEDTCSIHVRRGDYVGSEAFELLDMQYYVNAVCRFPEGTRFLIFSDDIPWCEHKFQGEQFSFVSDESPLIDMFIMASCQDHIIANSSFSWWGAWLNPSKTKRVIAPDKWFKPSFVDRLRFRRNMETRDMLPDGWQQIAGAAECKGGT